MQSKYKNNKTSLISLGSLMGVTLLSGVVLKSTIVRADVDDEITITVSQSCTMTGSGMTSHTAEIANGQYNSAIGTTNVNVTCNDNAGFAVYAIGYTDNTLGNNKLTSSTLGNTHDIATGTLTSGNDSQWAMKLATVTDPVPTYPIIIAGSSADGNKAQGDPDFSSFQQVPDDYTKVAYRATGTDVGTGSTGANFTTTYQAYISPTQAAGTYTGKVKYVLVHPNDTTAPSKWLTVNYDANGLYFNNDPANTSNVVRYDATSEPGKSPVTKYARSVYNADGTYGGYATPAGNTVVTIPGASTVHITVTYGVPPNTGGPGTDLYIWAGDHPSYTNANNDTSLTSCGTTNATNGAFHSAEGTPNTQVTMECDIASDSVTFYDYGNGSGYSTGYYAVVTGEGDVTIYDKTVISGTYATPARTADTYQFFGWSTDPNATKSADGVMYANESDFISSQAGDLANTDIVTLYAVWGKTFDAAMSDAGKTKVNDYYSMQDIGNSICNEVYVGATGQLADSRDTNPYTVGRLKDGNCWMLDNLALDLTNDTILNAMDETNTNASNTALGYLKGITTRDPSTDASGQYAIAKVANWTSSTGNSYSAPLVNLTNKDTKPQGSDPMASTVNDEGWKVGGYYNYCAASAGSYCYGNGNSDTGSPSDTQNGVRSIDSDICPAGWRMPTGNTNGEYNALYQQYGDYTAFRTALRLPLPGSFDSGSAYGQGGFGVFWSSTRGSSSHMYRLYLDTGYVNLSNSFNRRDGYSVRCVLGS